MFGKLFNQIFDGTLHGHLEATAVFMAMVALADRDGVVNLTLTALTRRIGWPPEFVEAGIRELEKPDPESRTPDAEGRRIVRLRDNVEWGWRIVNYLKYREIKDESSRREYMREYMREYRSKHSVNSVNNSKPQLDHAEADAEGERKDADPPAAALPLDPKKVIFDLGVSLLGEKRRALIGKAVKSVGIPKVSEVLGYLAANTVADPVSYFVKATTPREARPERFRSA